MAAAPTKLIAELPKRLRILAAMIDLGEKISWGSETALMFEAADALDAANLEVLCLGEFVASYNRDEELQSLMRRNNELLAEVRRLAPGGTQ